MAFGLDIPGELGQTCAYDFPDHCRDCHWLVPEQADQRKGHRRTYPLRGTDLCRCCGNIIDSVFYGLIFNESTYLTVATMFPEGGGYAPLLYGRVVDMLYFPVINTHYPVWFPWVGGKEFVFFRPIFNMADSSITTGVVAILIFQNRFFKHEVTGEKAADSNSGQL